MSELALVLSQDTAILHGTAQLCPKDKDVLSAFFCLSVQEALGYTWRKSSGTMPSVLILKALHAHQDTHTHMHVHTGVRTHTHLPNVHMKVLMPHVSIYIHPQGLGASTFCLMFKVCVYARMDMDIY